MLTRDPKHLHLRWKLASANNVANSFDRSNYSIFLVIYRKMNCAIMNIFKKNSKVFESKELIYNTLISLPMKIQFLELS